MFENARFLEGVTFLSHYRHRSPGGEIVDRIVNHPRRRSRKCGSEHHLCTETGNCTTRTGRHERWGEGSQKRPENALVSLKSGPFRPSSGALSQILQSANDALEAQVFAKTGYHLSNHRLHLSLLHPCMTSRKTSP